MAKPIPNRSDVKFTHFGKVPEVVRLQSRPGPNQPVEAWLRQVAGRLLGFAQAIEDGRELKDVA